MLLSLALSVVAALPDFAPPERLADLDQSPLTITHQLLAVNDTGALLTGDGHLWWYPIDGATIDLGPEASGARRLGARFIVLDAEKVRAVDTSTTPPTVTSLVQLTNPRFVEQRSSDAVWFFDDDSVWVTDGTRSGTRVLVPSNGAGAPFAFVLETGHRIGGFALGQFLIWNEAGVLESARQQIFTVTTSANGFVFGGSTLTSESGTLLAQPCRTMRGGGWATCGIGNGSALFSTDGTPAGTVLRDSTPFSFQEDAVSPDLLVYRNQSERRVLHHSGGDAGSVGTMGTPLTLENRVENGNLVCFGGLLPLDGGAFVTIDGIRRAISRSPGELIIQTDFGLVSSDGTPDGGRRLGDARATESSSPMLLTADGVTALYSTVDSGTWLTDGTSSGTVRVGASAIRWGSGAIGLTDAGLTDGFDDHGRPIALPAGIVGATANWALGLDGCSVFRVDLAGKRASLKTPRCPRKVLTGERAAFLVLDDGSVMLIHPPFEPVALGSDVDVSVLPRCGAKRCWITSKLHADDTVEFRSIVAETKTMVAEERPVLADGVELLAATDDVLVSVTLDGGFPRVKPTGKPAQLPITAPVIEALPPLLVASTQSETAVILTAHKALTRYARDGTAVTTVLDCEATELVATTDTFWVACQRQPGSGASLVAIRGAEVTDVTFELQTVAVTPEASHVFFVNGVDLMAADSKSSLRLTMSKPAGQLGRVREGLVFAAQDESRDTELWVLRFARPKDAACGCSSPGALLAACLFLFARRRR